MKKLLLIVLLIIVLLIPSLLIGQTYSIAINETAPNFCVFVGSGAGSAQVNAGQAVAIGYNAGVNPGGYAGTFVGYTAGKFGGGTAAVGIGYGALAAAPVNGNGNVAVGVHTAENISVLTGTTAIGYHALNGGGSSAQYSVVIGDHAADSVNMATDHSIILGPYSGISRSSTLWIDGTSNSMGSIRPLVYGEFDNRKFTINGDGLFGRSATNDSAASTAALEVRSTTQGFLPPRMTQAQRDAINSPPAGLMIWQTDNTPGLRVYDGSRWTTLCSQ